MFVQFNTLNATKAYFSEKLKESFSASEIRFMFQILAEERLGFSATQLMLKGEERLSESDLLYFREAANKLIDGVPFQHIVGFTYFYDLKIKSDKRALVPRPETEELVEWVLSDYKAAPKVLDICTGTGCIALAIKKNRPTSLVEGWDISTEALELAKENASALAIDVNFKEVDILKKDFNEEKWSVIISNPPYIPSQEKALMDKTVTDFDPDLALFVPDNDPLLFYKAIASFASKQLETNGSVYVEIHENLGAETMNVFQELGFSTILKEDLQGKNRMIKACKA